MSQSGCRALENELVREEPNGKVVYIEADGYYAIIPSRALGEGRYYQGQAVIIYLGITYEYAHRELREQFGVPPDAA